MNVQVRSECLTCTFKASCCSAHVLAFVGSSVWDREKKGGEGSKGGGTACTGGYKGVRAVQLESVAGGGSECLNVRVLNLGSMVLDRFGQFGSRQS